MSISITAQNQPLSIPAKIRCGLALLLAFATLLATSETQAADRTAAFKHRAKFAKRAPSGPRRPQLGILRPTHRQSDDIVWPPKNPVPIGTVGPKLEPVNTKLQKFPNVSLRPCALRA